MIQRQTNTLCASWELGDHIRSFSLIVVLISLSLACVCTSANALPSVEQADVIIVGAGLAGLSAALEAGRSGAKVLVIDEASIFGGHAIMSEGELNIIDSPFQRSMGIQDSPDLAYTDFTKWGEDNDLRWVRYYVEHSKVEIFDWVTAMGVTFHGITPHEGSSVPRNHLTDGRGLGLVRPVYLECLKNPNITFRWNVEVTSLLSDRGTVHGVRGRNLRTGQDFEFRAKAVILATGGFQSNNALALANWSAKLPKPPVLLAGSGVNSKGSGLKLATDVGAALFHLDHQWNYVNGLPDPRYPGMQRGLSISVGGVLVNNKGVDFGQKGLSDAEWFALAVSQPGSTYWQVFDDKQKQNFWVSGTDWANPATIQRVLFDDPSLIKRAGTLADLAQTTGLPVDPLTKSVMEYNEDHKTKIQTPPFYAAQLFPLARKSMGGIAIDHQARVLNNNAKAIPGLYAAGEATGEANINGKRALEGTFLGPAIITGRMAARTALNDFSIHGDVPPAAKTTESAAAHPPTNASCLSCHQLQSTIDKPRSGYWHFERVHKIVVGTRRECAQCHSGMGEPSTPQHHINPLIQANSCTVCHQSQ
jgi:succinate dehydrogenase/fumarate reductase flavoprotein subunit